MLSSYHRLLLVGRVRNESFSLFLASLSLSQLGALRLWAAHLEQLLALGRVELPALVVVELDEDVAPERHFLRREVRPAHDLGVSSAWPPFQGAPTALK